MSAFPNVPESWLIRLNKLRDIMELAQEEFEQELAEFEHKFGYEAVDAYTEGYYDKWA